MVRLASNTLNDLKRPYLVGQKLLILKLKVICRKLDEIAHFKLLRYMVKVIVVGHLVLSLRKAATKALV